MTIYQAINHAAPYLGIEIKETIVDNRFEKEAIEKAGDRFKMVQKEGFTGVLVDGKTVYLDAPAMNYNGPVHPQAQTEWDEFFNA